MENKNITLQNNLLNSHDFKFSLRFETDYAIAVKGGHLPFYFTERKKKRVVNDINLITPSETRDLIHNLFTSKN